jgi:hypothetical protein
VRLWDLNALRCVRKCFDGHREVVRVVSELLRATEIEEDEQQEEN